MFENKNFFLKRKRNLFTTISYKTNYEKFFILEYVLQQWNNEINEMKANGES